MRKLNASALHTAPTNNRQTAHSLNEFSATFRQPWPATLRPQKA